MAKLFVSYSRKDSVAARRLIEAFKAMGLDVWVDWEAIPPAVDWLEQIFRGIEEADAFIFMISPDSIASEVCKVEVGRAVLNNKRIIPIVLRDVHAKDTQDEIRKLNWTYLRETDNFDEGLAKVKTAIELDLDWLEEHRRLQVRALEWHRKKDASLLLRGRDLRNARHMMQTYTAKDPIPTELQRKYIEFSQRTERTRSIMLTLTGITLVIMIALTLYAIDRSNAAVVASLEEKRQRNIAQTSEVDARNNAALASTNEANAVLNFNLASTQEALAKINENEAQAQRSAARAQIYQSRPGELYTSILLGIDSLFRNKSSEEAQEILRTNISLLPRPVAQVSQMGRINAIAYNPRNETFATASADGSVCAWDAKTGKKVFCTSEGGPSVNAMAYSPDGTQMIAGDQSGRVQILNAENGDVQYTIYRVKPRSGNVPVMEVVNGSGPSNQSALEIPIRGVSFKSPDGSQVAVAYDDGQFPVFYPTDGRVSAGLFTGVRPNVFALSPNGRFLASGSEDGRDSIWDLSNNANKFPSVLHKGGVQALAFSPDNTKLATGGNDNTVSMISLGLKKELFRIPTQNAVRSLAFSPDNKWLVTASDDRIQIWNQFGEEQLSMSQGDTVTQVIVSPNSRWLATMGDDRTARIWDAITGSQMYQIPVEAGGAALAFSNDSQSLIVTDQNGGINSWDLSGLAALVNSIPFEGSVNNVQYSPSSKWAAVSDNNQVWLLRPNSETGLLPRPQGQPSEEFRSNVDRMAFSPDSRYLGISTTRGDVALYDIENQTWKQLEAVSPVTSIAFSPDSKQYMASDSAGNIQQWSLEGGVSAEDASQAYPVSSALAANSQFLAFGLKDKIVISGADGDGGISEIEAPGQNTLLASSADGSKLAATDSSGQIHIWNYQDGKFTSITSVENNQTGSPLSKEQAASLAFSPDGKLLAVGAASKVLLIDAASGDETARIPHRGVVRSLSFSADGTYLTTASSNFIQQWQTDKIDQTRSGELIQKACSLLIPKFSSGQLAVLFGDSNYKIPCE